MQKIITKLLIGFLIVTGASVYADAPALQANDKLISIEGMQIDTNICAYVEAALEQDKNLPEEFLRCYARIKAGYSTLKYSDILVVVEYLNEQVRIAKEAEQMQRAQEQKIIAESAVVAPEAQKTQVVYPVQVQERTPALDDQSLVEKVAQIMADQIADLVAQCADTNNKVTQVIAVLQRLNLM